MRRRWLGAIGGPWSAPVRRFLATVGDGTSASFAIAHNLNHTVAVVVYDLAQSPPAQIGVEIQRESANVVVISATAWESAPPAANSIEVLMLG